MMTRQHFKLIASVIADLSLSDDEHDADGLGELETLRRSIAKQFADALATTNPSFKRTQFLDACSNVKADVAVASHLSAYR